MRSEERRYHFMTKCPVEFLNPTPEIEGGNDQLIDCKTIVSHGTVRIVYRVPAQYRQHNQILVEPRLQSGLIPHYQKH